MYSRKNIQIEFNSKAKTFKGMFFVKCHNTLLLEIIFFKVLGGFDEDFVYLVST